MLFLSDKSERNIAMPLKRLRSVLGLATLLLISSCQDMGVDPIVGGPGIIVPGRDRRDQAWLFCAAG